MSLSLIYWIAAAVLLFWAVGAYNRLIRLRAAALQAYGLLDTGLRDQANVVQRCLHLDASAGTPESGSMRTRADLRHDNTSLWSGLAGAAAQFEASLDAARARPLESAAIAALQAAQGVLFMAWQRLQDTDSHDLAGAALPESLQIEWRQSAANAANAAEAFSIAVQAYNGAIAQFPALVLAWLFGFKPAMPL